ncbi:hypothetical protein BXZ70DRAFT_493087 [Cristinia sonorae]|uniref:DUF7918 domain-containing protein n=1 Tax=Cristinia sonorae TaxID=1940300 RepID=A0A8K0XM31_9AGAR|nr:hypothetical protein BXZ70DRAFT_493087 [Cristinia sonorae]
MPEIKEFGASLLVDGKELEEYDVEVDADDSTVTCFVRSVAGQVFQIKVHSRYKDLVMFGIMVDGTNVSRRLCLREEVIKGVKKTATSYQQFAFGDLRMTDEDDARDGSQWADLGSIEARVLRVVPGSSRNTTTSTYDYTANIKNGPVHERSKKAGTHRVTLGEVQTDEAVQTVTVDYIDSWKIPFVKIRFLYRPKDILQAQEIIPRTPSPPPRIPAHSLKRRNSEAEHPLSRPMGREGSPAQASGSQGVKYEDDHPSSQALTEKEERMRAMLAEAERIRCELEVERSQLGIKREPSPIRVPQASRGPGRRIFIDLTDD